MATYLERYRAGEHREVWDELGALGEAVRDAPVEDDARAVARETMTRVRRNLAVLAGRLAGIGYEFGVYFDGSPCEGGPPLARLSEDEREALAELGERAGPIPLSLEAFWREVGSVCFIGRRAGWPEGADPLVVDPPGGALAGLDDWEAWVEDEGEDEVGPFVAPLAPDRLHKDNVSGGEAYWMILPDAAADGVLRDEPHLLPFVDYLRLAILGWGGFPGYADAADALPEIRALVNGLEPF
ncbi:MAG TPA: hypothetical protein VFQ39_13790 [Longimicrobium sp.]|nr:hypothetical protein [Longimicrobium sp.]